MSDLKKSKTFLRWREMSASWGAVFISIRKRLFVFVPLAATVLGLYFFAGENPFALFVLGLVAGGFLEYVKTG